MKYKEVETIVAPATAMVNQTISIIRISGPLSFKIINDFLKKPLDLKERVCLRNFYDVKKHLIDQCVFILYPENKSFTGEESVEINCHGGKEVVKKILSTLLASDCRIAENGEFSKRAFLNNKIDLVQTEGINKLINATSERDVYIYSQIVNKKNSNKIIKIKEKIIDQISLIQTAIDYPEYEETNEITSKKILNQLQKINVKIKNIIDLNKTLLRNMNGINVVITGKTNVGKSSLLNKLLNVKKAIVSDVPGTTRDIIESQIELNGILFNLFDTAGIRKTDDEIEKKGIKLANNIIRKANLIIHVFDDIDELNRELDRKQKKDILYILNKTDLINKEMLLQFKKRNNLIFISTKNNTYKKIFKWLATHYDQLEIIDEKELIFLSSYDDLNKFLNINKIINKILISIKNNEYIDIIIIDLYTILDIINSILGIDINNDEVIDNIFKKYCLGK